MSLKLRRGTEAQRGTIVPAEGELIYTTDTKKLYIGDGTTTGGNILDLEIKGNLAGNLVLLTHSILAPQLEIDGNNGNISANMVSADFKGSVYADDSTLLVDGENGRILGEVYTSVANIKITGGTNGQYLRTDGTGNLTWHTVTGGGGGGASALTDLTDVSILSPHTGQILSWNGANWINSSHFVGDISGSVFADDSTKIIDGTSGIVLGDIYNSSTITNTLAGKTIVLSGTTDLGVKAGIRINTDSDQLDTYDLFTINGASNNADGQALLFNRSRGTLNNPLALQVGDSITDLAWIGTDSDNQPVPMALLGITVDDTPTSGRVPARMSFKIVDNSGLPSTALSFGSDLVITVSDNTLSAGSSSGQVNDSSVSTYLKINVSGTDYAIPLYNIRT